MNLKNNRNTLLSILHLTPLVKSLCETDQRAPFSYDNIYTIHVKVNGWKHI